MNGKDEVKVMTENGGDRAAEAPEATELATRLDVPPAPLPCTDEELGGVDFSRSDVLVGTVRSDAQFDYCMETRTYYIPAKTVTADHLLPSVIALYEEGLTRKAGIKRFGRITETRVVKRGEIPVPMSRSNPEEAYYLFSVADWVYLDQPIAIQDTDRGRPMFTCQFLLTHCHRSYQLLVIRSPEAYRLCELLCHMTAEIGEKPVFRRLGERHMITVADGRLRLITAEGDTLYTCPTSMLANSPAEVLRRVAKALGV